MKLADLHIHSRYSGHALYQKHVSLRNRLLIDSFMDVEQIFIKAKKLQLSAISITDHDTLACYREAKKFSRKYQITFIPGVEISTRQGDVLAYNLKKPIKPHLSVAETVRQIHDQHAIAVVAHPFGYSRLPKVIGVRLGTGLANKWIRRLAFDGMEIFDIFRGLNPKSERFADKLNLAKIAGSDAHILENVGKVTTVFPDGCQTPEDYLQAILDRKTCVSGVKEKFFYSIKEFMLNTTVRRKKLKLHFYHG